MGGRTGLSGHQIHALSPLPHRPAEEELRMKRVDDHTPAVGKQLAGCAGFSLHVSFFLLVFFIRVRRCPLPYTVPESFRGKAAK